MTQPRPSGVIAATATPVLPDFTPDIVRMVNHCGALLDGGCDAINLLGTTGEATSFSVAQRLALMKGIVDASLPMHRFLVGTGLCSLSDTVTLTQAACEMGFAGALLLPPFFYPGLENDGLMAYVDALLARVKHPALAIYLYHIPRNTQVPWPVEVVAALHKRHPKTIVGIKDSAGDLAYSREVARSVPGFDVFPSAEGSLATADKDGFAGCISASLNLTAPYAQECWSAQGTETAEIAIAKANRQRAILARQSLVASVKAALAVRYQDREWTRTCPPLVGRTSAEADTLYAELIAAS